MIMRITLAGVSLLVGMDTVAMNYQVLWKTALVTTSAAFITTNPVEAKTLGTGLYQGEEDIPSLKLITRWPIKSVVSQDWLIGDLDLQFGYSRWQSPKDGTQSGVNNVLELMPIFRFQYPKMPLYFFETSIGVALFSRAKFGKQNFGTNFQFSELLAFGRVWGQSNHWEISFQYQHYSNNGNTAINDGMDFLGLSLLYRYE